MLRRDRQRRLLGLHPERASCLFIYGFYPAEERWRVNIVFFLMLLIALYPVLFDKAPFRKYGLWYACAFPLHRGLAAGRRRLPAQQRVPTSEFGGIMLTLVIGVTGISFSLPLGILLALGRYSKLPAVKMLCVCFIEFIRGVPLITLLFVASTMLNYFLPPGTEFDLLLRVLIMVTLFSSAYIAEVIRGGLQAIPKGQFEAADSLGLKYWKAMRLIILPQALKISIPGIVNTFIGLFKDTTLVIVIGLLDPLGIGRASLADAKWARASPTRCTSSSPSSSSSAASACRATRSTWRTSCIPATSADMAGTKGNSGTGKEPSNGC